MHPNFAEAAALLSDSARASILLALLDGRSLPAGQLAMIANIAPQTASSHLSKMVDGRLLTVEPQGRHRYYRLAGVEVANAVEALLAITPPANGSPGRNDRIPDASLAYARSCYSHLAGRLAIEIVDALKKRELLVAKEPRQYAVTKRGRDWLEQLGIPLAEKELQRPRFARQCLDWTERRSHIAGELGSAMLARFRELKWIAPRRGTRAVRVTLEGAREFSARLGVRAASG
jgi:DNA-binding transcriptional ArsR family regulator